MSLLISFVTFILCASLLAFGGYQTVQQSDFEQIGKDFEIAIETEPELPEDTDDEEIGDSDDNNEEPGSSDNEGNNQSPDNQKPTNPDIGGNEKPGDSDNSDDKDDTDTPGDNEVPGGSGDSETPGGSGDSGSGDSDIPGGSGDSGNNDTSTTPPALSTTETKDAFKDLYNNHDSNFKDIKKDVLSNMITGILSTESDSEDTENDEDDGTGFDDDFNTDFSTDFDPDSYIPPEVSDDEEEDDTDEMISDVVNIYFDKLLNEIEVKQQENADKPDGDAEGEAFVEKEAEALAGLVNIVDNAQSGETPEDEKILQSVDAILESNVCMDTVGSSVDTNDSFTGKVQEATQDMNEDTKAEIQSKIETSLDEYRLAGGNDPIKEKQYSDLANLFGLTLNNA